MDLALNNLQGLICHKTQPTNQLTNLYSWPHLTLVLLLCRGSTASSPAVGGAQHSFCLDLVLTPTGWPWLTNWPWLPGTDCRYLCIYNFVTPSILPVHDSHDLFPLLSPRELSSFFTPVDPVYKCIIDSSLKGQYTTSNFMWPTNKFV